MGMPSEAVRVPTRPTAAPGLHPAQEAMSRDRIAALQLDRARATLRNAWDHVPWQRERLAAASLHPGGLRHLDDLRRLPFMVKDDLRDHYPFGLFARKVESLARIHASSGTTGKSTVVGYTAGDLDRWADLMARSMHGIGVRAGDLVHNAYGYGLFTGGLGAHAGAERLGCPVVPLSGGGTERQVTLLVDFGARVLCATPSYALAIAEVAEQMGVDLPRRGRLAFGLYPSQVEAALVGRQGLAPHYQLVVEREGALDKLRVEIEAQPGVDGANYDALARDAQHHVKSLIGVSANVAVLAPGALPRSQGRAVRLRDLRKNGAST